MTNEEAIEVLPCPMCEGAASIGEGDYGQSWQEYFVSCDSCGTASRACRSKQATVALWNTRAIKALEGPLPDMVRRNDAWRAQCEEPQETIRQLQATLAAPTEEPVAWEIGGKSGVVTRDKEWAEECVRSKTHDVIPLYATPQLSR